MTLFPLKLERLECPCRCAIDRVPRARASPPPCSWAWRFSPTCRGCSRCRPVDRTEVVYAEIGARYARTRRSRRRAVPGRALCLPPHRHLLGCRWRRASCWAKSAQSAIATYRLPSLLGGVLAVLAVWWLLRPLIGNRGALIAAALFAVTPIVALQAQLAIPEGPLLLAIVVAQTTLLRLYCAADPRRGTRGLALLFWTAQGFGILLNALAVPILSLSTLVALYVFDRDLAGSKRLRPLIGVPLMLVIAAPWLLVRAHLDGGVPFCDAHLARAHPRARRRAGHEMEGGAAHLHAGASSSASCRARCCWCRRVKGLWEGRAAALQRFLFCWLAGYLVYLELIASKPALYTVQAMFPAAAAAVALALEKDGRLALPRLHAAAAGVAGRAPAWRRCSRACSTSPGRRPASSSSSARSLVTALFMLAAQAARAEARRRLAASRASSASRSFSPSPSPCVLPHLQRGWPAARIAEAIAPLAALRRGAGRRRGLARAEHRLRLGRRQRRQPRDLADRMAGGEDGIAVVEDRWHGDLVARARSSAAREFPRRAGCVQAFNVMRGCPLSFSIYITGAPQGSIPSCKVPAALCLQGPAVRDRRPATRLPLPLNRPARSSRDGESGTLSQACERGHIELCPSQRPLKPNAPRCPDRARRMPPRTDMPDMAEPQFNPENPPELVTAQSFNAPEAPTLASAQGQGRRPRRLPDAVPRLAAPRAAAGRAARARVQRRRGRRRRPAHGVREPQGHDAVAARAVPQVRAHHDPDPRRPAERLRACRRRWRPTACRARRRCWCSTARGACAAIISAPSTTCGSAPRSWRCASRTPKAAREVSLAIERRLAADARSIPPSTTTIPTASAAAGTITITRTGTITRMIMTTITCTDPAATTSTDAVLPSPHAPCMGRGLG